MEKFLVREGALSRTPRLVHRIDEIVLMNMSKETPSHHVGVATCCELKMHGVQWQAEMP